LSLRLRGRAAAGADPEVAAASDTAPGPTTR
jgi:hypothetical protein